MGQFFGGMEWKHAQLLVLLALCLSLCEAVPGPLSRYNIDSSETTLSGLSSGACMSTQFHVAHSSKIKGVAAIAGCAYWCANANLALALECMDGYAVVPELVSATEYAAFTLSIDDPSHMKNSLVWLFSGTSDTVVSPNAVKAIEKYYQSFLKDPSEQLFSDYQIPAAHGWPTYDEGAACSDLGAPYINNCSYSSSGKLLEYFYGDLNAPVKDVPRNLFAFDQSHYTPGLTPALISMDHTGYVYVPTSCQNGTKCKLHICFHGCEQGYSFVQDTFIQQNQLNNWAETNNIIVLYPQVVATAVTNPKGCWDWWAYTGLNYATKTGGQISSVFKMMSAMM